MCSDNIKNDRRSVSQSQWQLMVFLLLSEMALDKARHS